MLTKHKEELSALENNNTPSPNNDNDNNDNNDDHNHDHNKPPSSIEEQSQPQQTKEEKEEDPKPQQKQLSAKEKALAKRLRKKQNALQKQKEREEEIANAIANAPNPRQLEIDAMKELYLNPHNLQIEEIAADGNCLYRAVARQLDYLGILLDGDDNSQSSSSYEQMRKICATQLLEARNEYEPFCDLADSNVTSYEEYVDKVRGSSEWGGHLELRALACALDKTIVVYSADGVPLYIRAKEDGSTGNDDVEDGLIQLSFHRRYYALGEHYNSVVKK